MKIRLVTYDFGGGYLRTDVEPVGISVTEHIDKQGNYEKYGFAFEFNLRLISFSLKLREFLGKVK